MTVWMLVWTTSILILLHTGLFSDLHLKLKIKKLKNVETITQKQLYLFLLATSSINYSQCQTMMRWWEKDGVCPAAHREK